MSLGRIFRTYFGWQVCVAQFPSNQSIFRRTYDNDPYLGSLVPGPSDDDGRTRMTIGMAIMQDESGETQGTIISWYSPTAEDVGRYHWFVKHLHISLVLTDYKSRGPAILGATPVPGQLWISEEENEAYWLLGQPCPFAWPSDQFLRWAQDRVS